MTRPAAGCRPPRNRCCTTTPRASAPSWCGSTAAPTQRQWSDRVVFRTTPLLIKPHSVVTLYVHQDAERFALSPRLTA